MLRLTLLLLTAILLPRSADAQGERYVEGPRRAAELLGKELSVLLPISLAPSPPKTQAFFDQGLTQVFCGDFLEAARSFQTILIADPDCPMAYWGLAQANVRWPVRASWFARAAWLKRGLAGPREKRLIDALARFYDVLGAHEPLGAVEPWNPAPGEERSVALLSREQVWPTAERAQALFAEYRAIVAKDPKDLVARTLLVGHLIQTRDNASQDQMIEAELQAIFERVPLFPAHAHRLRLWNAAGDSAVDPGLMARSAALVRQNAPWSPSGASLAASAKRGVSSAQAALLAVDALELMHMEARRNWTEPSVIEGYAQMHAMLNPEQAAATAWQPIQAPDWTLEDAFGRTFSLKDYRGKPLLVVNFLGFGCVHCLEQLQALKPHAEKFRERGVEIVAIGLQTPEELRVSMGDDPGQSGYPFPILCDPKLDQFKAYRSFDDFADTALHGTYWVDGEGRVVWHDISHLPYMDMDRLLERSDGEAR